MCSMQMTLPKAHTGQNLIDAAINKYGARKVAIAALIDLLTPKMRPTPVDDLSPWIQKDIGYQGLHRVTRPWEYML